MLLARIQVRYRMFWRLLWKAFTFSLGVGLIVVLSALGAALYSDGKFPAELVGWPPILPFVVLGVSVFFSFLPSILGFYFASKLKHLGTPAFIGATSLIAMAIGFTTLFLFFSLDEKPVSPRQVLFSLKFFGLPFALSCIFFVYRCLKLRKGAK